MPRSLFFGGIAELQPPVLAFIFEAHERNRLLALTAAYAGHSARELLSSLKLHRGILERAQGTRPEL